MASVPPRLLALDANLVLDLADGLDVAHDFLETFRQRGYGFRTAAIELRWKALNDRDPSIRGLANQALAQLRPWDVQPLPELSEIEYAIAEAFATRLRLSRLLPDEEFNDGLILAETSLAGIAGLVTSDHHLLDMDEMALRLSFQEADLAIAVPVHPRRLLKALR
jgi:hypothetical protein